MYTIYVCQENYEKYKEDKMEDRALGNKLLFQTLLLEAEICGPATFFVRA